MFADYFCVENAYFSFVVIFLSFWYITTCPLLLVSCACVFFSVPLQMMDKGHCVDREKKTHTADRQTDKQTNKQTNKVFLVPVCLMKWRNPLVRLEITIGWWSELWPQRLIMKWHTEICYWALNEALAILMGVSSDAIIHRILTVQIYMLHVIKSYNFKCGP